MIASPMSTGTVKMLLQIDLAFLGLVLFCPFRLTPRFVYLLQFGHAKVPHLAPLVPRYVLQPRHHQHGGRVAVREGSGDPSPPPALAVDALDPFVRPDPASVLRREFRAGQRLGEPVAHRPRGRPAELRHAELDFPDAHDGPSRVVADVVGIPARCPFIALGPDKLGRLLVERRVERLFDGLPHQVLYVIAPRPLAD